MNRRSFLRTIGLATTCAIIQSPLELLSLQKEAKSRYLKITQEMEKDINGLKAFINQEGLKLSNNDPYWESKTKMQIGFNGEDFVRNLKTVILYYKP